MPVLRHDSKMLVSHGRIVQGTVTGKRNKRLTNRMATHNLVGSPV